MYRRAKLVQPAIGNNRARLKGLAWSSEASRARINSVGETFKIEYLIIRHLLELLPPKQIASLFS